MASKRIFEAKAMPPSAPSKHLIPEPTAAATRVSWIKGGSSRWINDQSTTDGFSWQEGYGAFTVSISQVPRVRKYILNQEEHHKKVSFVQEFMGLLKKHGVAFNPKDFE